MSIEALLDAVQVHWPVLVACIAGLLVGAVVTAAIRSRGERELHRLEGRLEAQHEELLQLRSQLAQSSLELTARQSGEAALQARLEETSRGFAEKEALFKASSDALKQEFELLANRIFEQQGQRHQEKLSTVLSPFKEQIVDFRRRVEEVYHTESKDRASLLNEVRNLQRASERINAETENLTKALKGDVKLQGNWGEIVLERILEESGLRAGHEYFLQEGHRSDAGELKRPDVRIRLPDEKDVVVDAKVSLVAYEQALSADSDEVRERSLKQHLASLRAHVKRLSAQDYDQLKGVRSLDFVLLFVPIESAFTLAMDLDQRLFTEAFGNRIVIVSPTTLMMTLRVIHNVWRFDKQNRNAEEIASKAGALYDKLRGLIDDMETLGRQLENASRTQQAAYAKISRGKGNLVRQVEHFRELGAKVRKPLSKKVLEEADLDDV